jgi:hypothetical protein
MVLCPNGAQGDSPGQSEAPPWVRCVKAHSRPEGAESIGVETDARMFRPLRAWANWSMAFPGPRRTWRRRPQGVASLCPGLSHDTPSGLWEDDPNRAGSFPGLLFPCTILLRVDSEHTKLTFYVFSACMETVSYQ